MLKVCPNVPAGTGDVERDRRAGAVHILSLLQRQERALNRLGTASLAPLIRALRQAEGADPAVRAGMLDMVAGYAGFGYSLMQDDLFIQTHGPVPDQPAGERRSRAARRNGRA